MSKIWNRGRGGKEALTDKPLDFENPVQRRAWAVIGLVSVTYNGHEISSSSATLCRLVSRDILGFQFM